MFNGSYANMVEKTVIIEADANQQVQVSFDSMCMEYGFDSVWIRNVGETDDDWVIFTGFHHDHCTFEYVEWDGWSAYAEQQRNHRSWFELIHEDPLNFVGCMGSSVEIHIFTDTVVRSQGFELVYEVMEDGECQIPTACDTTECSHACYNSLPSSYG